MDGRFVVVGEAFVVAGAAPTTGDPGEGAFDDPAAGQYLEASDAGLAFDDGDGDGEGGGGPGDDIAVVATAGPDVADDGQGAVRGQDAGGGAGCGVGGCDVRGH